jgi:inward rectifier potassium channel
MAQGPRRRRGRETLVQLGNFETVTTDVARYDWRDPYHAMLTLGWRAFLAAVIGYYLLVNALFGAIYALLPGGIANLPRGAVGDAFFFSVETFATVGYGVMAPQSLAGHLVATAEIFTGLLSTAVITGLVFVRFSRPRQSLVFTRQAVIAPYDGVPTLMVRIGNRRAGLIVNVESRFTLVLRHTTEEGYVHWRAIDLPLLRPRGHALTLVLTLMHRIDAASPLHGMDAARLEELEAQLVASFTGTDQTIAAAVHAMQAYDPKDMLWGHRFADMVSVDADGHTRVMLARLHDVVAV